jgi:hypothetical protein
VPSARCGYERGTAIATCPGSDAVGDASASHAGVLGVVITTLEIAGGEDAV